MKKYVIADFANNANQRFFEEQERTRIAHELEDERTRTAYKKVFNRAVRTDDIPKMAYQREIPADVPDCVKDFQRDCFWYEDDEQDFWVFLLELINRFPLNRYIYHPEKTMEEFDRRYEHLLSSMDEIRDELKRVFAEREKEAHNA